MIVLRNDNLNIRIESKGAELVSVQSEDDYEYIWQAGEEWPRHSPVLFPIEGRLKGDQFTHNGIAYKLGQHGFARDMDFELEKSSRNEAVFLLKSNEDTLKKYPFLFQLRIGYLLKERCVTIRYTVSNCDTKAMFFSIGAHPGFNTPGRFEDWSIKFSEKESLERHYLEGGLFHGETATVLKDNDVLPLDYDLFERDAMVFKNPKSGSVVLRSTNSRKNVIMNFEGFPFLGIWTKPGAPFVCIEPWYGLADSKDSNGEISHKEGIQKLEADEIFKTQCSLTFL